MKQKKSYNSFLGCKRTKKKMYVEVVLCSVFDSRKKIIKIKTGVIQIKYYTSKLGGDKGIFIQSKLL